MPQRVHLRSGGPCWENSNGGAAGRIDASFRRAGGAADGEAKVLGGEKKGGATDWGRGATD